MRAVGTAVHWVAQSVVDSAALKADWTVESMVALTVVLKVEKMVELLVMTRVASWDSSRVASMAERMVDKLAASKAVTMANETAV